ncbi:MAG: hypothetical protein CFE21_20030 [Bacteroidetes bacterium B1(2017)]|nr:MAG: hypothetical protein CFE21_20030 [Bacteroidetes bacterium B1(2017)]
MNEAINYKLIQFNILIQNGWVQSYDGSWWLASQVDDYNNKRKPMLTSKQKLHADYMIKKLYITNDLLMFYQTAEVFMKAMEKKSYK